MLQPWLGTPSSHLDDIFHDLVVEGLYIINNVRRTPAKMNAMKDPFEACWRDPRPLSTKVCGTKVSRGADGGATG